MKSSEDQEDGRDTQADKADNAPAPTTNTNEEGTRGQPTETAARVMVKVDDLTEPEKAELVKWEADKYIDILKFFLDLGVKGVGLFYAITGGILTIYFGRDGETDSKILIVFLLVPAIISIVLGIVYAIGAVAARKTSNKLNCISGELKLGSIPKLFFVPFLIAALSLLFIVTGAALGWFYYSVG